ncbi:hypothetical protein GQ53DRAFT_780886 [Thozetella sp. PMI_491]|nr:hypothetical protein GQ53DRAFT_780886 [Thozetella sp. PMI_491]
MSLNVQGADGAAKATPEQTLQQTLQDFQSILSADQILELQEHKTVPDADAVLVFTAELDSRNRNRRGRSIASNLFSTLQCVRDFSAVIDTFVSSHPEVAALVWGSVRLTMVLIVNFASYYEAVAKLFMEFGHLCPRFAEYQALYPNSARLQKTLCDFHASLVRCCKHVIEAIQRPWRKQLFHALWESFEQEFKPDTEAIRRCSAEVKEELALAKARADHHNRQLQELERQKASNSRNKLSLFFNKTDKQLDRLSELQLEKEKQHARDQRQRLLDTLSTHDYLTPFKQSRRKRHGGTAQWIFQTPEYDSWINNTTSPLLWCSGKIGSGKTIVTASVVDRILTEKQNPEVCVAFFFPGSGQSSKDAETVIRSIIRQLLTPRDLPETIDTRLEKLTTSMDLEEHVAVLKMAIENLKMAYIIVDGLDEFEKQERTRLLKTFSGLHTCGPAVRIFLAARESISAEIFIRFPANNHVSMSNELAALDIKSYIDDIIQERLEEEELTVGDPDLVAEIGHALLKGANGMFLWVVFQIDEICLQSCDDDIRTTLQHLPKSLSEVFDRVLHRILVRGNSKAAQRAFKWIAVAKRPLRLVELREILFVETDQQYSKPELYCNVIDCIASWSENLVRVDEELQVAQFAHDTIRQHLLQYPSLPQLEGFHINHKEADHRVGEICITYLNFSDFKTTLARRPKPVELVPPSAVAQTVLESSVKYGAVKMIASSLISRGFRGDRPANQLPQGIVGSLAKYRKASAGTPVERLQGGNPFLAYASKYWMHHTSEFAKDKSRTWNQWNDLVRDGHPLAQTPWGNKPFSVFDPEILYWCYAYRHYPLLSMILEYPGTQGIYQRRHVSLSLRSELTSLLLEGVTQELSIASYFNHFEAVDKLIAAGADVNATPLHAGTRQSSPTIVRMLLDAGANSNDLGQTSLHIAASKGDNEIVDAIISAGANIDAEDHGGQTALHTVAFNDRRCTVDILISAGADIYARDKFGRTPVDLAASYGNKVMKDTLLLAHIMNWETK